jgi:hypothetical protein
MNENNDQSRAASSMAMSANGQQNHDAMNLGGVGNIHQSGEMEENTIISYTGTI